MTRPHAASVTDWDRYYRESPAASRFTRPIIEKRFIRALRTHFAPNPVIAELGGAGSRVLDSVLAAVRPTQYHVIDSNRFGLELLQPRAARDNLVLHHADVLNLDVTEKVDVVFSLGLIEHFDAVGTRRAVEAHFRMLKTGGVAIISFPTPTLLYRTTRKVAELAGKWIFHDERPLRADEVIRAIGDVADVKSVEVIWPIFLTQTLLTARKK